MSSRRILITGLASHLGGRLAQALEREPDIHSIVGLDTEDPRHELQRTEFVRVETEYDLLRRILNAAAIDTVIDTRLITNPLLEPIRRVHEINVTDTAAILGACSDKNSPVRKLVFKSSAHYYGWERGSPAFFTEDMRSGRRPSTAIERDVVQAEKALEEFAALRRGTTVTILRLAEEIEGDERTARTTLLGLPVIPAMLGFDPRFQFVHEDDVVAALSFAVRHVLPGIYNVAGDGVLVLSEVASLLGKTMLPILPPWGAGLAAVQLRRLGFRVPVETLRQLRHGRGLDNRRLKAAGYSYRYTSREAVLKLRARQRLRALLESGPSSYRYEPEVEEFLRWSPSVHSAQKRSTPRRPAESQARHGYDRLSDTELIEMISSLEPDALNALRRYEASHQARASVLEALDRTLARKRSPDDGG